MKNCFILGALFGFCAMAHAGLVSVGLDYVSTTYDAGTGVLTMDDDGLLVTLTYADGSQNGFFNASFNLTTTQDSGFDFSGGSFLLTSADGTEVYLSGSVESIVFDYGDDTGTLSGSGVAVVSVENLDGDLLGEIEIVSITFNLSDVVDFESSFSGDSKINFLVPEPATLAMLGLGALSLIRHRRK